MTAVSAVFDLTFCGDWFQYENEWMHDLKVISGHYFVQVINVDFHSAEMNRTSTCTLYSHYRAFEHEIVY